MDETSILRRGQQATRQRVILWQCFPLNGEVLDVLWAQRYSHQDTYRETAEKGQLEAGAASIDPDLVAYCPVNALGDRFGRCSGIPAAVERSPAVTRGR
jgi:hypothetical protein